MTQQTISTRATVGHPHGNLGASEPSDVDESREPRSQARPGLVAEEIEDTTTKYA
jgi:hypothetical protein